jgi:hypothetical protein
LRLILLAAATGLRLGELLVEDVSDEMSRYSGVNVHHAMGVRGLSLSETRLRLFADING